MKLSLFSIALFLLGGLASVSLAQNATPAAPAPAVATPTSDLNALVLRIKAKIQAGQKTAEALASELAEFDALRAKYRDQKTDEVAQISFMEGALYIQILGDMDKGNALITQLKADFPGTKAAVNADRFLTSLENQAQAPQVQAALIGKAAPELHFKWSSRDDLKTLSALKGKVVVLDFWATWCGPCVGSFPQVRELVEHYKGADVVVVGVTSIQGHVSNLQAQPIDTKGDPAKEMALMQDFIKAKDMTWTVAFSEEEVFNSDYGIMGIPYMAIIAPDGTVRHAGLHPAMPLAEKTVKIDALLKEFGLKVPDAKS
jgi:thiol-disulfide isomerase/thioredoxin